MIKVSATRRQPSRVNKGGGSSGVRTSTASGQRGVGELMLRGKEMDPRDGRIGIESTRKNLVNDSALGRMVSSVLIRSLVFPSRVYLRVV